MRINIMELTVRGKNQVTAQKNSQKVADVSNSELNV